jgi:hypothetical protein
MAKQTLEERAIYFRILSISCTDCGHSWGEHRRGALRHSDEDMCSECWFEEVHQERETDAALCTSAVPSEFLETPPTAEELANAMPFWSRWRVRHRNCL